MTITQNLATALDRYTADLDSIDRDFTRWEWTQAMTPPAQVDPQDSLSAEEAAYYGII